ncbi:UDP-N-acetylglucosamine--N-acetylmuramyl-(pentapeptide) pyrophosphoryl-undecaprenol N-acetylglucosamine transferase [Planctomicrobium sp. SH668]|uniref:UDP-N-acetylglucosamine--N-acetylmuramyl- (pentapeptide) pyrophosphoryl-undecaprenol N-acetylglucosamine transferase n=1 Tax=Planctomicrobium sp. SH668 TaxID=3448126 RepID=UPI003F5AE4DD
MKNSNSHSLIRSPSPTLIVPSRPASPWSLVVCGGGSGGHLFPALAVIEQIQTLENPPERVLFLSAERAIDKAILEQHGVEQVTLPAVDSVSFRRHPIRSSRALLKSTQQAIRELNSLTNPIMLGTGGYSSVPGVLAGRWRRHSIVLLEQNIIPGRATTLLLRFAETVCVSFLETQRLIPEKIHTVVTGNPIRQTISQLAAVKSKSLKQILVLGGSQGAIAVNDAMVRYAGRHRSELKGWTIVHQTGVRDAERIAESYKKMNQKAVVSPFFDNMRELYETSGIIVTRAGGTSLAEIACAGVPCVIIPYPKSLRNHQRINAQHFVGRKAAYMIEQGEQIRFDAELETAISKLVLDKEHRKQMAAAMKRVATPEAAQKVCEQIRKILAKQQALKK